MASVWEHQSRNALAALAGFVFPPVKRAPESVHAALVSGEIRKILFVRPQQGIGDMMMLTPVFRALKERFPFVELQVLASARNSKALTRNPHLSRVWIWKASVLSPLRKEAFDLAIPVFSHTPSWTNFAIARGIGARTVWGFDSRAFYGGNNWSRHFSHVELPAPDSRLPEWRQYAALIEPLIGPLNNARTEYGVSAADQSWAREEWNRLKFLGGRPVVGLFLGGNPDHPARLIGVEQWMRFVERFEKEGASIVLIHPPQESFLYKELSGRLRRALPVMNENDLGRVLAFLQRLSLFICPDGGTFHLAAGAGVNTVGIFTSTDPVRWCPPGPHARAIALSDVNLIRLPTTDLYSQRSL